MQSKKHLVIFIHGYRGSKNELSFLKKAIESNNKYIFFSFTYGKRNSKNEVINIKNAEKEVAENINKIVGENKFHKVTIIGYSLGAAIAIYLCAKNKITCHKLIALSVFDSRKDLFKERGAKILSGENLSPIKLVKGLPAHTKIYIVHGVLDKSIWVGRALKVFLAAKDIPAKIIIGGFGHKFKTIKEMDELKLCLRSIVN